MGCGFYLDAHSEEAFTVWRCAVAVSQSVCPSVIQKPSRKSLNKTARRSGSNSALFVNLADTTHYTKAIRRSLLDKPYGWRNNVFAVLL